LSISDYPYTALFCEENIWKLLQILTGQGRSPAQLEVILLCNQQGHLAIRNQKLAPLGEYIVWDYHVILVDREHETIYDFDSRLDFPVSISRYLSSTLPDPSIVPEHYLPTFRVIPAQDYLERFCSDRSHMLGKIPESEFPDWPLIECRQGDDAVRLDQYRDIELDIAGTCRLSQAELIQRYLT
jgi:hypothetical protein